MRCTAGGLGEGLGASGKTEPKQVGLGRERGEERQREGKNGDMSKPSLGREWKQE
jgi:hypothetical protein